MFVHGKPLHPSYLAIERLLALFSNIQRNERYSLFPEWKWQRKYFLRHWNWSSRVFNGIKIIFFVTSIPGKGCSVHSFGYFLLTDFLFFCWSTMFKSLEEISKKKKKNSQRPLLYHILCQPMQRKPFDKVFYKLQALQVRNWREKLGT